LALALREPDRVNKMVLMGPGGMIPVCQPWPSEGLRRMFDFYEGDGPTIEKMRGIVTELVYDVKSIPESLIQERFAAATRPEYLAAPPLRNLGTHPNDELWRAPLNRLTHETLLTLGREDRTLPLDAADSPQGHTERRAARVSQVRSLGAVGESGSVQRSHNSISQASER
jgi:4,5:9,10-diseco-3-hydroxy-5,9,17-trioxoandrosta-1(10),2-diene-4-oate hydrolase